MSISGLSLFTNIETIAFVAHHVTNYLSSNSFVLLAVDDIHPFHAYDHKVFDRLGDSLHYGTALPQIGQFESLQCPVSHMWSLSFSLAV